MAHHTDDSLSWNDCRKSTLTHDEELQLFAAVQKIVNGRVPLIARSVRLMKLATRSSSLKVDAFGGLRSRIGYRP